jgi:hypothetical protein
MKMKLLFIIVCAVSLPTASNAQILRIGFKGGANYSNVVGNLSGPDIYDSRIALHGGVMLNFPIVAGFASIQPEILFSSKGFEFDDTPVNGQPLAYRYEGRVAFNYIDVPILMKLRAGALFFDLGPQVSYLLRTRQDFTETIMANPAGPNLEVRQFSGTGTDELRRIAFGYAAGMGFEAHNGVRLGIRYNGDLSRFARDTYFEGRLANARHSVFQLYLGFLLPGHP